MEQGRGVRGLLQIAAGFAAVAVAAGVVAGAILLVGAFVGDGDAPAEADGTLLYDPADAESIARRAVLDPDDLAAPGWNQRFENAGIGEGDAFETPFADASSSACRAFTEQAEDARDELADQFDERTAAFQVSRLFERPGFGQLDAPSTMETAIAVFSEPGYAAALVERYSELFVDESFLTCMEASFAAGPSGAPSTLDIDAPSAEVPEPGVAIAMEVRTEVTDDNGVPLTRLTTRIEVYIWAEGNTLIDLVASGRAGDIDDDLVVAAVQRAQEKLVDQRAE